MQLITSQPQLPPLPPKPNCFSLYSGSPCDVLKQQYNAAVQARAQLAIRGLVQQQREQAADQAASETRRAVQEEMQPQIESARAEATQLRAQLSATQQQATLQIADARYEGFRTGISIGCTFALVLSVLVWFLTRRALASQKTRAANA